VTPSYEFELPTVEGVSSATAVAIIDGLSLLVEYDNGRKFVRVNQKGEVQGSISFQSPDPGQIPAGVRLASARYDNAHHIVWIASFLRASIFAFHLSGEGSKAVFDRMIEIPLQPLGAFRIVTNNQSPKADVDIFYKYPRGFSHSMVDQHLIAELVGPKETTITQEKALEGTPETSPKVATAATAAVSPGPEHVGQPTVAGGLGQPQQPSAPADEDLKKAAKTSVDVAKAEVKEEVPEGPFEPPSVPSGGAPTASHIPDFAESFKEVCVRSDIAEYAKLTNHFNRRWKTV
jgi:hypothetical protein